MVHPALVLYTAVLQALLLYDTYEMVAVINRRSTAARTALRSTVPGRRNLPFYL